MWREKEFKSCFMIRRYRQTDWQSVTEIYLQCKPAEFAGEAFAEKGLVILPLQDNLPARRQFFASDVFVCERDKQVVGFITLEAQGNPALQTATRHDIASSDNARHKKAPHKKAVSPQGVHIGWLYVCPRWQSKGIGRQLLKYVLSLPRGYSDSATSATLSSTPEAVANYSVPTNFGVTHSGITQSGESGCDVSQERVSDNEVTEVCSAELGTGTISLCVTASNHKAIRLYQSCQFDIVGRQVVSVQGCPVVVLRMQNTLCIS